MLHTLCTQRRRWKFQNSRIQEKESWKKNPASSSSKSPPLKEKIRICHQLTANPVYGIIETVSTASLCLKEAIEKGLIGEEVKDDVHPVGGLIWEVWRYEGLQLPSNGVEGGHQVLSIVAVVHLVEGGHRHEGWAKLPRQCVTGSELLGAELLVQR